MFRCYEVVQLIEKLGYWSSVNLKRLARENAGQLLLTSCRVDYPRRYCDLPIYCYSVKITEIKLCKTI